MSYIRLLIAFLSLGSWFVFAQQPPSAARMSLDEIESVAQQNNPEIRSAARRIALAETAIPIAGALDDPMLMYRNWGTPLSRPYRFDEAQQMFMVQQTLPGPGKRALRSDVGGKEARLAKIQLEIVRRDVSLRVRKAFYDLLRNSDDVRIHHDQVELAKEAFQSAKVKYTVGRAPQQDLLKAQIAVTRLAEHLISVQQEGDLARATLNTLMGRDPSSPLELVGSYREDVRLPALLDLEKSALENRPELKAVQQQQDIAAANISLARKAYTPDFTVAGGYMLMPPGATSRNTYAAEATMSLPWLNRGKHDAEIKEANTKAEVERDEFDRTRNEVFLEIQQALVRAQAAQRALALYTDTLRPQAQATLKAAAAAYQHDRTDFLNLIDSQNMMLDVQSAYFRARSELDARRAELERAVGAPIPRENAVVTAKEVSHDK
jgi:outer membrane protein TolC